MPPKPNIPAASGRTLDLEANAQPLVTSKMLLESSPRGFGIGRELIAAIIAEKRTVKPHICRMVFALSAVASTNASIMFVGWLWFFVFSAAGFSFGKNILHRMPKRMELSIKDVNNSSPN